MLYKWLFNNRVLICWSIITTKPYLDLIEYVKIPSCLKKENVVFTSQDQKKDNAFMEPNGVICQKESEGVISRVSGAIHPSLTDTILMAILYQQCFTFILYFVKVDSFIYLCEM